MLNKNLNFSLIFIFYVFIYSSTSFHKRKRQTNSKSYKKQKFGLYDDLERKNTEEPFKVDKFLCNHENYSKDFESLNPNQNKDTSGCTNLTQSHDSSRIDEDQVISNTSKDTTLSKSICSQINSDLHNKESELDVNQDLDNQMINNSSKNSGVTRISVSNFINILVLGQNARYEYEYYIPDEN